MLQFQKNCTIIYITQFVPNDITRTSLSDIIQQFSITENSTNTSELYSDFIKMSPPMKTFLYIFLLIYIVCDNFVSGIIHLKY